MNLQPLYERLEKAKYISKKRVGNKWVYKYKEDEKGSKQKEVKESKEKTMEESYKIKDKIIETKKETTKRLQILKNSLKKKEKNFDDKLQNHFDTVKQSHGQPLNDKRNGRATLDRWDRQNDSLRNLQNSIEKTKQAIEREQGKISEMEFVKKNLPSPVLKSLEKGELIQWRKYPNIFFVKGVDKARLIWDKNKKFLKHNYVNKIEDKDQYKKFASVFNRLKAELLNKQ